MKAYSQDLRERVVKAVDQGMSHTEITKVLGVSSSSIKGYVKVRAETGSLAPKKIPGCPAKKMGPLRLRLQAQLEAHPDASLEEHCQFWQAETGVKVSISSMSRVIQGLKWTRKKKKVSCL
jgi:transposase